MSDHAPLKPPLLITINPIVGRELLSHMRSSWTYLLFGIPPVLQSVTLMGILGFGHMAGTSAGKDPAHTAFQLIFWIQAVTLGLMLPGISSAAIARERTDRTLTLLATTGLSPFKLYSGKFTSLLLYGTAFVGASLPIWLFTLYELRPSEFWWFIAFLGSFLVLEITLSLFWSALSPTVLAATTVSYCTTAWWCMILILLSSATTRWELSIRDLSGLTFVMAILFGFLGYRAIKEHGLAE